MGSASSSADTGRKLETVREVLAGEPPFGGGTVQAVLGRIIAGTPVSPTERRPSLPPNVDAAIRKALEKVPADRFTDARVFAAALGDPAFRHGEAAHPASAPCDPPVPARHGPLGGERAPPLGERAGDPLRDALRRRRARGHGPEAPGAGASPRPA